MVCSAHLYVLLGVRLIELFLLCLTRGVVRTVGAGTGAGPDDEQDMMMLIYDDILQELMQEGSHICSAGVVLVCVVPTLIVAIWGGGWGGLRRKNEHLQERGRDE